MAICTRSSQSIILAWIKEGLVRVHLPLDEEVSAPNAFEGRRISFLRDCGSW